ncbi:MAG TPA: hypothetical protein VF721_12025 [Pyrinomonadaceae bacterium]|jgi:hypothetical protein
MSKIQLRAIFLLLFLSFVFLPLQNKIRAQAFPVIKPSNVVDAIYAKKQKNPRMSAAALAAFGNALIKKQGYDFSILDCAIPEANGKSADTVDSVSEIEEPFKYEFEAWRAGKKTFQIMSKFWGAPCGCSIDLPVLQIRENQWTTVADGKPIVLKRPKDFYFIEVEMLDKTFKKTVKTFYKPIDNSVVGISADGTKIYTELAYDADVDVMLEISDTGTFQIVPRRLPNIIKKTIELTEAQTRQREETSDIHHFKAKNKSYFLLYDAPCT